MFRQQPLSLITAVLFALSSHARAQENALSCTIENIEPKKGVDSYKVIDANQECLSRQIALLRDSLKEIKSTLDEMASRSDANGRNTNELRLMINKSQSDIQKLSRDQSSLDEKIASEAKNREGDKLEVSPLINEFGPLASHIETMGQRISELETTIAKQAKDIDRLSKALNARSSRRDDEAQAAGTNQGGISITPNGAYFDRDRTHVIINLQVQNIGKESEKLIFVDTESKFIVRDAKTVGFPSVDGMATCHNTQGAGFCAGYYDENWTNLTPLQSLPVQVRAGFDGRTKQTSVGASIRMLIKRQNDRASVLDFSFSIIESEN